MKFKEWVEKPEVMIRSRLVIGLLGIANIAVNFYNGSYIIGIGWIGFSLLYLWMALLAYNHYKKQKKWEEEIKDTIFDETK